MIEPKNKTNKVKTINDEARLSCKLTTPEMKEHKRTVVQELKKLILETVETEGGFKYRFEGSDKILDLLNGFIKTERQCCDFFVFNLMVSSVEDAAWLELSGPEGTKDFIKQVMEL
jgi:hypothetical protein